MPIKKYCKKCGHELEAWSIGWYCTNCKCFEDMNGNIHEHKEEPFMPTMTNAEKIRCMTDEELAKFIMEDRWDCNDCPSGQENMDNPFCGKCDNKCVEHCLDWLRKEVDGK